MNAFQREQMLLGQDGFARLRAARVAVFGLGGVGGQAAEALARCGVGALDLIDHDTVSETNLNRQTLALRSTIGQQKTDVMARRIADIDPGIRVTVHPLFYLPETADRIDLSVYDYVVDCIDTVAAKLLLAERCRDLDVRLIAAMGAGNKLDPSQIRIADISGTSVCPLARVMRTELRKRGIHHLTVAFSTEPPRKPVLTFETERAEHTTRRDTPGSIAFVPSAMGLMIAGQVVRELALPDEFGGCRHA